MNVIVNKKIAIIGGGPGGLTLARLLQMKGTEVIHVSITYGRETTPAANV